MAYHWLRSPKALILSSLMIALLLSLACGGTAATPIVIEKEVIKEVPVEVVVEKEVIKEVPKEVVVEKVVIKEVVKEVVVIPTREAFVDVSKRKAPIAAPVQPQTGKVVTDRLIAVIPTPGKDSTLDCEVTGAGTIPHRPSVEYMLAIDHRTGDIIPMLATEWGVSADGRTWSFEMRKGVPFHFGFGELTTADMVNSMNYYTYSNCKATVSNYFSDSVEAEIEVVDDYNFKIHARARPAAFLDYWFSEYRSAVPITSKAQWDKGCPQGSAQYEEGFCKAGTPTVQAKPARTGPYQFVSYEPGVGYEYERVGYDHWRVNPDFAELEIKFVKEPATRLAIMLAREGHVTEIPKSLHQEALDGGLAVADSSGQAYTMFLLFGGAYYEKSIRDNFDPTVPWVQPGEIGKKVRMAMNKALDRDLINEAIFEGQGTKQWVSALSPSFPAGYHQKWEKDWDELYGYDPKRAKELLAEAGYPDGFSFPVKAFALSGVPEMPDVVEAAAGMWEAIGLKARVEEIEFARMREMYRGMELQGLIMPFRGPNAPAHTRVHFYFSAERFFRAPATDTIQATKDRAYNTTSADEANALWQEVSDELFYNVHTIPMVTLPVQSVYDPEVIAEHVFLGPSGGATVNYENIKGVRK